MFRHERNGRKRSHATGYLAFLWAGTLLAMAAPDDTADKAPAIVKNGGFEDVGEVSASRSRGWTLPKDRRGPGEWTLSAAYAGTLNVLEEDAPEGRRFVHLKAKPKRAAHLSQKCPRLQAGLPYRVSIHYRGGPVEIRVYEYDWNGKLFADRAFMRSEAATDGVWALAEGICTISLRAGQVWLAVTVPAGKEADLDDLRVERESRADHRRLAETQRRGRGPFRQARLESG